jgi:hypothetical protein
MNCTFIYLYEALMACDRYTYRIHVAQEPGEPIDEPNMAHNHPVTSNVDNLSGKDEPLLSDHRNERPRPSDTLVSTKFSMMVSSTVGKGIGGSMVKSGVTDKLPNGNGSL